ncbi:MAG: choice-of-anchor I domain-containing protein, partial [Phycisphaerales bacterium]
GAFGNSSRVQDVHLDPVQFRDDPDLNSEHHLGRLKILNTHGDMDGDGDFDVLYSFGSRSLSILDPNGKRISDTGSLVEQKLSQYDPEHFNANNDQVNSRDSRSDDRGPEPEGVVVGLVEGVPVAFLGLERPSGIMAFDCSNPLEPAFSGYVSTRNNNQSVDLSGDRGPEGLCFIKAKDSPTGEALLVVSYETSGSICVFKVSKKNAGPPPQ